MLKHQPLTLLVAIGTLALTVFLYMVVPKGFFPVQDTVVQVIEQQLNGIDHLRYVSSESNSDGSMSITATFEQGTDPDTDQVQVQNKLNLATPLLPQEVQQQGIRVIKALKMPMLCRLMVIGCSNWCMSRLMRRCPAVMPVMPSADRYTGSGTNFGSTL